MSYDDISEQVMMLRDAPRTEAYARAIAEVVEPGQIVVDLGCGTGILSVFAARAGAARVYAIEATRMVHVAERIAAANGIGNITFLHQKSDEVTLPEKVNVLVSEWMGMFLFREKMFEAVVRMRDRVLAPGGVMVPSHVSLHGSLVASEPAYNELTFLQTKPYGVDYSPVADWLFCRTDVRTFARDELVGPTFDLGAFDMATCGEAIPPLTATFHTETDLVAHGICGWFTCRLSPSHVLDTSPFAPPTHWKQMFFPFSKPVPVRAGEPVTVVIEALRVGKDEMESWKWSVQVGAKRIVMDDFMDRVWLETADALAKLRPSK